MTNRAYLKNSSSARLLTMLMTSQMRRLPSHAPTAISSTSTAKHGQVGRSVGGPASAPAISADEPPGGRTNAHQTPPSATAVAGRARSPAWSRRRAVVHQATRM